MQNIIVPVSNNQRGSSNSSLDLWDPELYWDDLFQNFPIFPSMISTTYDHNFPSFGGGIETHVNWKETRRAHVFRAVFNSEEDVLVHIDDENMLEISTENGKFMSKFKLPENAKRDEVKACMLNGVLTVTIPKEGIRNPNVRSIEISGSG
ncbi:18.1 kDa class I heat shock protein [Ricinus communis]|uniref:Heat-shock protein, putative n=1 Tax=Ricinus communis TaxID=3988 RepID=B9RE65_RICCO|nr:18.1 kDa class I heat shock protein [Ricinus communis]EEF50673.1 heat-shock protein, putative [Ricinus communis]|eukprot:XP_002512004.1 18.1 kDa class I heat shock protein [Ricinus communis]